MLFQKRRAITVLFTLVALLFFTDASYALTSMPETDISVGSKGIGTQLLQNNLIELSLLDPSQAEGEYDAYTMIAVRKLQQMLGLYADGMFDRATAEALNEYIVKASQNEKPLKGYKIGIDPGHQKTPDNKYEPVFPDSERTKERMSAGCVSVISGVNEYEIVLLVSNKLKKMLEASGATVVMTRTGNDVSVSNAERAQRMNNAGVDCWVRIHCDYSSKKNTSGAYSLSPSKSITPDIYGDSLELSKLVLTEFCKITNAKRNTVLIKNDQTGMNWSTIPVTTIEMGYLSNPNEDSLLNTDSYQTLCAQGIYNGILAYCKEYAKAEAE